MKLLDLGRLRMMRDGHDTVEDQLQGVGLDVSDTKRVVFAESTQDSIVRRCANSEVKLLIVDGMVNRAVG